MQSLGPLQWLMKDPEIAVTLIVGLITAFAHWRRTGKLPLGRLPYSAIRKAWTEVSTNYMTRKRPRNVPALIVDASAKAIDQQLRQVYFESGDLYSFEYEDEKLNFRRPDGEFPDPETKSPVPSELHARCFELDDGRMLMLAHHEASRFEAWGEHIRSAFLSWSRGRERMKEVLDGAGVSYEQIESEADAGVKVVT